MNPLRAWLAAQPKERLAVLTPLLIAALLVAIGVWHGLGDRAAGQSSPRPSSAPSMPGPPASPSAAPVVDSLPPPAELEAAERVGGQFAVAYATASWTDTMAAVQDRVRPYATSEFVASLAQSSSSAWLRAQQAGRHEATAPSLQGIASEGYDDQGKLGLIAQLTLQTTWDGGGSSQTKSVGMFLRRTGSGWRVDEVEP